MASKRTGTVEIPGEPASSPEDSTPPAAEGTTTSPSQEDVASATAAPNPLTASVALQPASLADTASADQAKGLELSRQSALINAAREGKVTLPGGPALDWSHLTNPAAIMAKIGADPEAHLPNPDDVDWSKIQGDRVLTKQGWLLKR